MPVVDIDTDELRELTGHDEKTDGEFEEDLFALGLEFEGETDEGDLQFEFGPDRLDRLSVEGVARSLRYQYGDARGVHVPDPNDADWTIEVDESVPDERPFVTGAVVRGLDLDESALDSLIQLQEKLHATMGRERAKGAIGIHDLTMLKGGRLSQESESSGTAEGPASKIQGTPNTITYRGVDPDGDRFVPLDSNAERTPAEVLEEHPVGGKYADLVADLDRYPAIYDELGLFSFPPVINGRRTEVSTDSRDLFVELTGTDQWTIDRMCVIICYALAARGGTLEEVEVVYDDGATHPDEYGPELIRPNLETDEKSVSHERIESTLGVELDRDEVVDLFERSGLDAAYSLGEEATTYDVTVPPYRVDVLHPLDLIDDVGRAYGFNSLDPTYPDIGTIGGRHERSRLEDAVRTSLVGLGFQDTLNFHMTSAAENYDRMGVEEGSDVLGAGERAEITSPYSEEYTQLRTWALPSLAQVLENNTHRPYPQDLAEVGFVARRDDEANTRVAESRHVAAALARTDASYEDAKARLQALCDDFDAALETPATDHPSFISGRVAAVVVNGDAVGVVGELHPAVLVEHDMEVPVAAFEFDLSALA
ncbi:phenylalanine--tRNA ligase subunit beta [Halorarum halobium]|uniref:phenylalanine--tRNA ligase subunit beta n=1 Tax=Halorarum halobium TaxID=3075121 RepID=UPI0028AE77B0|nr:phenylalanine--tRNA ligase subunit beta [Halobaculum sp. XH14]